MNPEKIFYWLSIAGILFGGMAWLTTIDNKASASADAVPRIEAKIDRNQKEFEEIRIRLTHIEDAIK